MRIKDLSIGKMLFIGLSAIISFVIVLGLTAYIQTNKLHNQTEILYNEALQTRHAIGEIQAGVYLIHWALETAFAQDEYDKMLPYITIIRQQEVRLQSSLGVLRDAFPDDIEHIMHLMVETTHCKENRDQVLGLILAGNPDKAAIINIHKGTVLGSKHFMDIKTELENISTIAFRSSEAIMKQSDTLNKSLSYQLLIIVSLLLSLALIINFIILKNLRSPLKELTYTTESFTKGNLNARNKYDAKNEIGTLSSAFNTLADSVQLNSILNEKTQTMANIMLNENDLDNFLKKTLNALLDTTNSHMAVVYLLNNDRTTYEHYASVGIDLLAKKSFSAINPEGEIGAAVSLKTIQHIIKIPEDSVFLFNTAAGKFVPSEMLIIPMQTNRVVKAVISLASLTQYNKLAIEFINRILSSYSARLEGLMLFRQIKEFTNTLELQNLELEAQKTELSAQSSELTEQNNELEMQKKQLDEANRLKTVFLSNMSHELRTPLNSIIALSGLLKRRLNDIVDEENKDYLQVIERNGNNLLLLINDILDLSRIEAGYENLNTEVFDLIKLTEEVMELLKPLIGEKAIDLTIKIREKELKILSDKEKCRHILQNIIGNAIKFTETGSVNVIVRKLDEEAIIDVTDTGIGISEQHLPHIFNEFRQADTGTSKKYGGTGLGLAITKKHVNILNGNISVKSVPGMGSSFTIRIPLKLTKYEDIEETITHKNAIKDKSDDDVKTILLVDDSEPALIQIKYFLEESGYNVLTANNGNKALDLIKTTIPHAIILDLMMPELDGFAVLKEIREADNTAHIPVMILSAKHIEPDELKFLKRNNVHQLVQKGNVKREQLLEAIENMINKTKAE